MDNSDNPKKKGAALFHIVRFLVKVFYHRMTFETRSQLPEEAIIVGNHSQMNGPIACELYFPPKQKTWCIADMMDRHLVPAYAYQDFWSGKPKYIRWFFRILAHLIAPLSECIFTNAQTIPVYKDKRVFKTFALSVSELKNGGRVVIFPECYDEHNNIVHKFQQGFVNVARQYFKETGREPYFVPLYICPSLKRMITGKAIQFNHEAPFAEEQTRICDYLMNEISEIAYSLPEHTVVPYPNVPKSQYPRSTKI